jgi:hypothetical protein
MYNKNYTLVKEYINYELIGEVHFVLIPVSFWSANVTMIVHWQYHFRKFRVYFYVSTKKSGFCEKSVLVIQQNVVNLFNINSGV